MRKTDATQDQVKRIRSELRVRADWSPETSYGPPPAPFKVYLEDEHRFCLPKHWAVGVFGEAARDGFRVESRPNMRFHGTLSEELKQPAVAQAITQAFRDHGGGILSLYTGAGKTVLSIHAACQLKLKTLVVVNKTVLLEQWRDRISSFVPAAKIGTIQGPTEDTEDKDFVIAMLQSLSQREYGMTGFGLAITDECNHVAAPTFSQAMLRINCPYTLGLSATPERKDGLTRVLLWFIGPIFLTLRRENEHIVQVQVMNHFGVGYQQQPPPVRYGKLNFEAVVQMLCEDEARNQAIVDRVLQLPSERKALLLSARREHCKALVDAIGSQAGLYLGGMHQRDLTAASEAKIVVATFSVAAEGLDIPALNTLLLTTPKRDVVQACGRIMRGALADTPPLVIDIHDRWPCLAGQYYARMGYYKQAGFSIAKSGEQGPLRQQTLECMFG